jgi:hypothetical protein
MRQDEDLKCLDKLISEFGGGQYDLLLEHLRTARRSLLGSMAGEYRSSLLQAKESLGYSTLDKGVRTGIRQTLQGLIEPEASKERPPLADGAEYRLPSVRLIPSR